LMEELERLKERLRRKVVVDEDLEFLKRVDLLSDFIKLDPESGPIMEHVENRLNQRERILFYLFCIKAGKALDLWDRETACVEEIAGKLGLKEKVVHARVSELMKRGLVVNVGAEKAMYKITNYGVLKVAEEVLGKLRR